MAQQLRVHALLTEDLSSVPTYIRKRTTTCNPSSRNLTPSSCLCPCSLTQNHKCKHIIKNRTFNKITNGEVNAVACTLVIPALVMPMEENHPEFDVSLGYRVRSCLKKHNKTTPKNPNLKTNPLNNLTSSIFLAHSNNVSFKQSLKSSCVDFLLSKAKTVSTLLSSWVTRVKVTLGL